MANTREIVHRIHSVNATRQITSAMKMVATAKLGKVQQKVTQLRCYADQLTKMLQEVVANTRQSFAQNYLTQRPVKNTLLVVISSDRGLCGSFNAKVFKKALQHIQTLAHEVTPNPITILPIGNKAVSFFKKKEFRLIVDYVGLSQQLSFGHTGSVVSFLIEAFMKKTYDQVMLVYNTFQNATTHTPTVEPLLPIVRSTADPAQKGQIDYIHEPSNAALIETLVPHALQIQFYKAQLESNAAEHGARMTTMSKATENAEGLLKDLRLTYNRTRQAVVTQEISEIVAGTGALAAQ